MKFKLYFLFIIFLLGIGGMAGAQTEETKIDIEKLLPLGEVKVELLELQVDPEYKELQAKFQQGMEKNPEWWTEYSAKLEPGKELPYHANFGLNEKEFERLTKGIDMNKLMPGDSAIIKISKINEHEYFITTKDEKVEGLDSVRINTEKNTIKTMHGLLDKYAPVKANDEDMKLTGRWNGHVWKTLVEKETSEGSSKKEGTFSLGTMEKENRTILLYKLTETIKDNKFPYADVKVVITPPKPEEANEIETGDDIKKEDEGEKPEK